MPISMVSLLAMLRHCLPETPSLRAADLNLNDNQILRLAHILCVDEATIRRTTFTDIARSSRCLIATDAIQSCSTCCPAKTEPRAILRSQLLGWRITCALCGDLLQSPSGLAAPQPSVTIAQRLSSANGCSTMRPHEKLEPGYHRPGLHNFC